MKNIKKDTSLLAGLILSISSAVISNFLSAPPFPLLSLIGSISSSISANFLYRLTPQKIKGWVGGTHPNDLNHNIKKLFIESIDDALSNIGILFSETNHSEEDKKNAKLLIKSQQKHLKKILSNGDKIQIGEIDVKQFLYDANEDIVNFIEAQIGSFGIADPFKSFLSQNLPFQIQLCFGEGLKNPANNNAWIAFQRMLIEDIRSEIKQMADSQQSIKEDLSDLKFEKSGFSKEQILEIHQLVELLNNKKLISIKLNEGISQSLSLIEKKANEIIYLTTNTNITVDQLKVLGENIERQNRITHTLIYFIVGIIFISSSYALFKYTNHPFTASIRIVDWKGEPNASINNFGGKITIWLGNKEQPARTIADGNVQFSDIPAKYKNKKVNIQFISSPEYESMYIKDNEIILKRGESSDLKIYIKGIDSIHGYVRNDSTKEGIDRALVSVNGASTYTDSSGKYIIHIPIEKQEIKQIIRVEKENFEESEKEKWLVGNTNPIIFDLKVIE